jgi:hypothetical protein
MYGLGMYVHGRVWRVFEYFEYFEDVVESRIGSVGLDVDSRFECKFHVFINWHYLQVLCLREWMDVISYTVACILSLGKEYT